MNRLYYHSPFDFGPLAPARGTDVNSNFPSSHPFPPPAPPTPRGKKKSRVGWLAKRTRTFPGEYTLVAAKMNSRPVFHSPIGYFSKEWKVNLRLLGLGKLVSTCEEI